jgi:hypothetical protein
MPARTPQTGLLLALRTKSKSARPIIAIRRISWFSTKEGGTELGGAEVSLVHGKSTIAACSPSANAALGLCKLSEDEAESHVQAAHGKEEKCGDKREFVNVVGENRCPNANNPHSTSAHCKEGRKKHLQSLEDPEGAETELRTEDREKAVEKGYRPGDLG